MWFKTKNMKIPLFIDILEESPESIEFADTIATIDKYYDFTQTAFHNGEAFNEAGVNSGSCKLFSFAQIYGLSKEDTLNCFGSIYRKEVLKNPEGVDHQNIRNFMNFGWEGIKFEGEALKEKKK